MFHKPALFAAAGAFALAGCAAGQTEDTASASGAEGRSCFFLSQVNGFNDYPDADNGRERILVSVGVRDKYVFETFGSCPELDWSEAIAFDQRGPGRICSGLDVDLIVPTTIGPQRCPVRMIRKLSQAEIDAM